MSRIKRKDGTESRARLPIVGKIKVGKKNDKGYPTSVDYFIPYGASGVHAERFHETYGDKPNKLTVVFLSDEDHEIANERYEGRTPDGRLWATGDGERFRVWDAEIEDYVEIDASTKETKDQMNRAAKAARVEWKEVLTLRFLLPGLRGLYGLWELTTRAPQSSNPALIGTVDKVREMSGGRIAGIPFDLVVRFAGTQRPGQTRRFPVVELIPNISPQNIEALREWQGQGKSLHGILSDQKIEQLKESEAHALEIGSGDIVIEKVDGEG